MPSKADRPEQAERGVFTPRRSVVVLAVVLTVGIMLGLGLGYVVLRSQMATPEQRAAAASPLEPLTVTAPVLREERQQTVTLTGAVENSDTIAVRPALPQDGSASVLVKSNMKRGENVDPGMFLAEISGYPVFAISGAFPFYRDLTLGDTGEDVAQLQKGLEQAGYSPGELDGELRSSTQRALEHLLRDAGYPPDLLYDGSADEGRESSASGGDSAPLLVPRSLFVVMTDLPVSIVDVGVSVGDPLDETSTLMSVTNGPLVVTASISTVQAANVTEGQSVTFTVQDQDGELTGTVSGVESDPDNPDLSSIFITPDTALPADAVGRDARAEVVTASTDGAVLVVPIGAVRSDSSGSDYVLLAPERANDETALPERHPVVVREVIDGAAVLDEGTAPPEGAEVIVAQSERGTSPASDDAGDGDGS
ncbi:peptidoglycan hydrolase-like protein with peptidoglycan-binding domain [Brachybacterium aquaticum]|uniref:Peptidoglycan hydrolase-like protein with peptidoglycan-binding domain n=2 Tax=Brachybacterium aquaticum TaxID=1432564 RepID=A0A841AJ31_9MICO|nr:peptidoglycan hydrolase-like protein with peptidoglycan-binding domain [Brachybacterium aquaticum]